MKKRTPGNWFAKQRGKSPAYTIRAQQGDRESKIIATTGLMDGEANSRLIACAPQLLKTLENLIEAMRGPGFLLIPLIEDAKLIIKIVKGE